LLERIAILESEKSHLQETLVDVLRNGSAPTAAPADAARGRVPAARAVGGAATAAAVAAAAAAAVMAAAAPAAAAAGPGAAASPAAAPDALRAALGTALAGLGVGGASSSASGAHQPYLVEHFQRGGLATRSALGSSGSEREGLFGFHVGPRRNPKLGEFLPGDDSESFPRAIGAFASGGPFFKAVRDCGERMAVDGVLSVAEYATYLGMLPGYMALYDSMLGRGCSDAAATELLVRFDRGIRVARSRMPGGSESLAAYPPSAGMSTGQTGVAYIDEVLYRRLDMLLVLRCVAPVGAGPGAGLGAAPPAVAPAPPAPLASAGVLRGGAASAPGGGPSRRAQHRGSHNRSDACFNFNEGRPCAAPAGQKCRFQHVCRDCGAPGHIRGALECTARHA